MGAAWSITNATVLQTDTLLRGMSFIVRGCRRLVDVIFEVDVLADDHRGLYLLRRNEVDEEVDRRRTRDQKQSSSEELMPLLSQTAGTDMSSHAVQCGHVSS